MASEPKQQEGVSDEKAARRYADARFRALLNKGASDGNG